MSFLKRMVRDGISKGVSDAIGKAVKTAVEPKATELANKAAARLEEAAENTAQSIKENMPEEEVQAAGSSWKSAFSNLERAAQDYATEMSKNVKVCPECGQPAGADQKFCPNCGGKLPENTVAQESVCPSCGKQNKLTAKFCADCGTKLPSAIRAEEEAKAKDAAVMAQWEQYLSQYPKWKLGGTGMNIETYDSSIMFVVQMKSGMEAQQAVAQYRQVLLENGFRQAGQYPSPEHLYKMVGGVCYHVDTEHCFDGDSDTPTIYFSIGEPTGGFNYVKEEPKKQIGLKGLFKL